MGVVRVESEGRVAGVGVPDEIIHGPVAVVFPRVSTR
jgi:hypothetical protein